MYDISQKYFSSFLFIIKLLILSGAYYVISQRLFIENNFNGTLWTDQLNDMGSLGLAFMLGIVSFTFLNWVLEIRKWKFLTSSIQKISFLESMEQSLGSLTASLITPNRIGEYGAKAMYYSRKQRPGVLIRNFIGNASQMSVTVIFGVLGIFTFRSYLAPQNFLSTELLVTMAFIVVSLGFLFYWIALKSDRFSWLKNIKSLWEIPYKVYQKALTYSVLRYLVFSHQFYLLMIFFDVDIAYPLALSAIALMYFISSAIPGFVLFDWLVKGSVAVTLFGFLGVSEIVILCISTTMWIMNFALPAMIGSVYVMKFNPRSLVPDERKLSK